MLATKAQVSAAAVYRFEAGESVRTGTVKKLEAVLSAAGVSFTEDAVTFKKVSSSAVGVGALDPDKS